MAMLVLCSPTSCPVIWLNDLWMRSGLAVVEHWTQHNGLQTLQWQRGSCVQMCAMISARITLTTTADWVSAGNHDATAELLQHSAGLWVSTSYVSTWCIQTNRCLAALFFRLLIVLKLQSWGILYKSLLFTAYAGCDKTGFVLESAVLAEATNVDAAVLMNLQIALSSCVGISLQRRAQACLCKLHAQSVHCASTVYGSVRTVFQVSA